MKQFILAVLSFVAFSIPVHAQYTVAGKIEFERKVNFYAQLKEMEEAGPNPFMEQMKSKIPKFSTSYFDMIFDTTQSIYKPGREAEVNNVMKMFGGGPATANVVYTNFKTQKAISNKKVFDQSFHVMDTMRVLEWRIKDEIRTIANFKCHKAVGIICDSVYVVAFYTEDILASGGPEMFGGLPGMILELAVPRLHTTWTATKFELISPVATDFVISDKGKKVTSKELQESLESSLKNFGKMAQRNLWWSAL